MVTLPDNILAQANLTEKELRIEIALLLYSQKRLSSGQARELGGLNIYEFQQLLTDRDLFVNYEVEDLEADLKTIQSLHKTRQSATR